MGGPLIKSLAFLEQVNLLQQCKRCPKTAQYSHSPRFGFFQLALDASRGTPSNSSRKSCSMNFNVGTMLTGSAPPEQLIGGPNMLELTGRASDFFDAAKPCLYPATMPRNSATLRLKSIPRHSMIFESGSVDSPRARSAGQYHCLTPHVLATSTFQAGSISNDVIVRIAKFLASLNSHIVASSRTDTHSGSVRISCLWNCLGME